MRFQTLFTVLLTAFLSGDSCLAAEAEVRLAPGQTLTIRFPEMPPTLFDMLENKDIKPMMTVFLPQNYDPQRKHPLLIFLGGGNGGQGGDPSVARKLCEEKDFVCVGLPLFKEKIEPVAPGDGAARMLIRAEDCKFAWPFYKTMLARLEEAVPNIDPAHRVLGGFSNGAHTTGGLIDQSDGEVARRFSAFFFVEGGGRMRRYDLLKGRPLLLLYGAKSTRKVRIQQISDVVKSAGVKFTLHEMKDVGHAFPESEYPFVRTWLRGPALE